MDPPGTVTIKIYSRDNLYNIVSKYAFEHGNTKDKLASGIAQYNGSGSLNTTYVDNYEESCWDDWSEDVTKYSEESTMDDSTIKVQLLPRKFANNACLVKLLIKLYYHLAADFDEELTYKGHVVKVVFKDSVMTETEHDEEHIAVRYIFSLYHLFKRMEIDFLNIA